MLNVCYLIIGNGGRKNVDRPIDLYRFVVIAEKEEATSNRPSMRPRQVGSINVAKQDHQRQTEHAIETSRKYQRGQARSYRKRGR